MSFNFRKLAFTPHDLHEISDTAVPAFVSTFYKKPDESNDVDDDSNSDLNLKVKSDLNTDFSSDQDPDFSLDDLYGCEEITESVKEMVKELVHDCSPLESIYGDSPSEIIKDTVTTATEGTQCSGLKFFGIITPGEDQTLISECAIVAYWCCCETIKKVSPIIAEATITLLE